MNKMIGNRRNLIFAALVVLAPVLYVCLQLQRTSGLFFPPDEFGYWENVARMLGLDWSGSTFMQSYYAKGYSMLLYPLAKMFSSTLSMYKGAVVINAVLFGLQGIVLLEYLGELMPDFGDNNGRGLRLYIIAATGVFYPAHFVYMNYTIAETLVCLLVTVVFWMLAQYENNGKVIPAMIAVISAAFLLFTHFRTIGVLISVLLIIPVIWQKKQNRKPILTDRRGLIALVVLTVCVILIAVSPLRSGIKYLDDQLNRLQKIITIEGALDIIMGIIGKLFYISVSTFGLFFLCVRRIWRKRREWLGGVSFAVAVMISIMISAVFFVGGKGIDYLVYGRYTEIFAPIIVCIGLVEIRDGCKGIAGDETGIKQSESNKKLAIICSVIMASAAVVLVVYAAVRGMNVYMNDFIIGLAWMFGRKHPLINQLIGIPTLISIVVLWMIIWLMNKSLEKDSQNKAFIRYGFGAFSITLLAVFTGIGLYMSEVCVYHFHELDRRDVELFEWITEEYDKGHQVDFLRPPGVNYIGHLQFYMFDRTINYIDGPDPEAFTTGLSDIVVTYDNYEFRDMLAGKYASMDQSPHFVVYYN